MKAEPYTLTAYELIRQLSTLASDAEIYVWIDGERLPIAGIDPINPEYADINVRIYES